MLRLLRSELYRLQRRWMPWIMLGVVILAAFGIYFLIWASTQAQIQAIRTGQIQLQPGQTIEQLQETLLIVTPQRVQDFGVSVVSGFGSAMLIVFAASHVGTEFGWGTFRTLLAHGASKQVPCLEDGVADSLRPRLHDRRDDRSDWRELHGLVRRWPLRRGGCRLRRGRARRREKRLHLPPYMALALAIAVWSKSAGAGIAAGLVVYFVEGVVATLLVSLNKDYAQIVNWGLSRNASALTRTAGGPATQDPTASTLPDPTQAAMVLAVYSVIFLALAYWRLRSRDVTVGG